RQGAPQPRSDAAGQSPEAQQGLKPAQTAPGKDMVSYPAVHIHNVTVRYGRVEALNRVSLDLAPGRTLAIVGPNGAGKSTLIKVALGLIRPDEGHTAVFGHDAGTRPDLIGYVPQLKTFDRSFPATALELVVSGLRRSWPARTVAHERTLAAEALELVGAGRLLRRRLAKLSGGELQRVYLARALVRRPQLVLLDEPATGVDFLAEHDLYDLLERYQAESGAAIVMITHDLTAARWHTDTVAVLNRRLHALGDPAEALSDAVLRKAYGHRGHRHGPLDL
ncbi:MAG TPA: metal ABC transporter ATP-binding protein, partial [Deinococcales bacterium]|nr:metal ABC transporter ATP-binding protein [Deinococcales bacterium]